MFLQILKDILTITYQSTNRNERIFFFGCLSFGYAISIIMYFGYAIWFEEPVFLCRSDQNSSLYFQCTQQQGTTTINILACSSSTFKIDTSKSGISLSLKYKLYCDRLKIQHFCIFIMTIGCLLGGVSMLLFKLKGNQKIKVFVFSSLAMGISMLSATLSTYYIQNQYQLLSIICLLFLYHFFQGICCSIYNSIVNEFFHQDFSSLSFMLTVLIQGFLGISIPFLCFFFQGNWQIFLLFTSLLIISSALIGTNYTDIQPNTNSLHPKLLDSLINSSQKKKPKPKHPYIPTPRSQILKNFGYFQFLLSTYLGTVFFIDLELQKLGGQLYLNTQLLMSNVIIGSLIALYIKTSVRSIHNYYKIGNVIIFCEMVCFSLFLTAPLDLNNKPWYLQTLFISNMYLVTLMVEVTGHLLILILPLYLHLDYYQHFFAMYLVNSRILISLCPYIIHYYTYLTGLKAISSLTFFYLLMFYFHKYKIKKINQSEEEQLQNSMILSDFNRFGFHSSYNFDSLERSFKNPVNIPLLELKLEELSSYSQIQ